MTGTEPSPAAQPPGAGAAAPDHEAIAAVAALLHETADHHGPYEASHTPHNWWDWYAAYFLARQQGRPQDEAVLAAGRYMQETKHVTAL
jgi:hypothetical protein